MGFNRTVEYPAFCYQNPTTLLEVFANGHSSFFINTTKIASQQDVDATTMQGTTFFDLPAELRIHIYELALFHYETGGIISPLRNGPTKSTMVLVDGRRYNIRPSGVDFEIEYKKGTSLELTHTQEKHRKEYERSSNAQSKHICSRECLLQPSVTKSNRQFREEALPVFYAINHVHFEMSNFEVTDENGQRVEGWSPTDWWRETGDTNLRFINKFSLVCHPSNPRGQSHLMLEYRHSDSEMTLTHIHSLPVEKRVTLNPTPLSWHLTAFGKYRFRKKTRHDDHDERLSPCLDIVRESGLHVQVLECMLEGLEPCNVEYLRDHQSLNDEMEIGTVKYRAESRFIWIMNSDV